MSMPYRAEPTRSDRVKAIASVVAIYAAMIAAMMLVRTDTSPRTIETTPPVLIEIEEPPPPPPPEPDPGKAREEEGAAGKKDEPTPIVAPEPKIVVPAKPPVAAAPVAGTGLAPNDGSGTGRGGGGAGGGGGSPAKWLSGGLKDSDYPRAALREKLQGQVSVRFTVLTSGRIDNCRVVRSSGSGLLDATTCRLLSERLRFRPATDGTGQPIQTDLGSDYTWGIHFHR
jgi:protein TonB